MKPADPIARTPFGNSTNNQMSGLIDFFLLLFNKLFHKFPLSFWIVFYILDDVTNNSRIYEIPMSGVIQTSSDYQSLHEKMCRQTRLRVQRCWQNKDIRSS
jgi:hypothetical protein